MPCEMPGEVLGRDTHSGLLKSSVNSHHSGKGTWRTSKWRWKTDKCVSPPSKKPTEKIRWYKEVNLHLPKYSREVRSCSCQSHRTRGKAKEVTAFLLRGYPVRVPNSRFEVGRDKAGGGCEAASRLKADSSPAGLSSPPPPLSLTEWSRLQYRSRGLGIWLVHKFSLKCVVPKLSAKSYLSAWWEMCWEMLPSSPLQVFWY